MQNFPKKPFDLKDFLAQKGKAKPQRPNYWKTPRAANAQATKPVVASDDAAEDAER